MYDVLKLNFFVSDDTLFGFLDVVLACFCRQLPIKAAYVLP